MGSNKRFRSLQSVLWESENDPEDLRVEWFGKQAPPTVAAAVDATTASLREENVKLRGIIQELQKQVFKLSNNAEYVQRAPKKLPTMTRKLGDWDWLNNIDPSIAKLPRMMEEVVPSLKETHFGRGAIKFDLHYGNCAVVASTVLAHCQASVESIFARHPAIFKIGLTKCPVPRWNNKVYGYLHDVHEKWSSMKILFVHSEALAAGLVEAALIQYFQGVPGCRNINQGGEGVDKNCPGPYFTYVVYRVLTPPAQSCS